MIASDPVLEEALAAPAASSEPILIRQIRLQNILSFGPDSEPVPLRALNVIIGPNGSGKSNFIDALSLLQAAPKDLAAPIRKSGGVSEWIHKGKVGNPVLDALVAYFGSSTALRYWLTFEAEDGLFSVSGEYVKNSAPLQGRQPFYYNNGPDGAFVSVDGHSQPLFLGDERRRSSILSLRNAPELYPELSYLGSVYQLMRFYREWSFGRNTILRQPQKADMPNHRLEEDFSNLGLVMNRLRRNPIAKAAILKGLRDLYDGFTDFDVSVEGGTVQVFFTEGDFVIPATRLSDGMLRYLCLLVILCDPDPPPLICIEEPELGMHPDILPGLADLLIEASQRTQLVVTTHSDLIVDVLSDQPESVLTCEKQDGSTVLRRLEKDRLKHWLEKYRLGELWMSGEIGAKRW